ncbi:hypothetical protein [Bacteroidetes bacterium endosymbiont of Geopemphigus sp.]|uniref:hypothetical protein n=1 Tax=Bacteroidetes bacterium endosymbiont of Geopemphigus sp. TaxID=2047937 RepID=UPI000CD31B0F|nr:hypothetical protein [Bacteroidetes bacterium endosymbiont of Geopemphigus sp.]
MEYSQINTNLLVEQLEVWVLDKTASGQAESRLSILALRSLGESGQANLPTPGNNVIGCFINRCNK